MIKTVKLTAEETIKSLENSIETDKVEYINYIKEVAESMNKTTVSLDIPFRVIIEFQENHHQSETYRKCI